MIAQIQNRGHPKGQRILDGRHHFQKHAQGEDGVQEFVDSLLTTEQDAIIENLIADGSEESLSEILLAVPDHVEAVTALAMIFVESNRVDEALALLKRIPESSETRRIEALAEQATSLGTKLLRS